MATKTYRGVRIRVVAGRKDQWGYCKVWINGVPQGRELGTDEAKLVARQHGYIDLAIAEPHRMAEYWQPGYKETA